MSSPFSNLWPWVTKAVLLLRGHGIRCCNRRGIEGEGVERRGLIEIPLVLSSVIRLEV